VREISQRDLPALICIQLVNHASASVASSWRLTFWSPLLSPCATILRGQHVRCIATRSGCRRSGLRRAIPVVGVGRRMDTNDALTASHEIEKSRATGRRCRRVRIIQKTSRCAIEEDRIKLLQVGGRDVSQAVTDGCRPQIALVPSASTVFAAKGIEACTKPPAPVCANTRTLRARAGFNPAAVGSAAIMPSTSVCTGTIGVELPYASKPPVVAVTGKTTSNPFNS